jgi:large subunit ribosomal protein L6
MSRIGKLPIALPSTVTITNTGSNVTVKGPKGELSQNINADIDIVQENNVLTLVRKSEDKDTRAKHGLYRSLISNMVKGVSEGYKLDMELVGVGYRANANGQNLELSLGFSHNVVVVLPKEVSVITVSERGKNPLITLQSHDKHLIGMCAAKIRSLRKPEPYKGKGIRFVGEVIRRKAGKSASKK